MSKKTQEAYRLHCEGWTQAEIADHLGCSPQRAAQLIAAEKAALACDNRDYSAIAAQTRKVKSVLNKSPGVVLCLARLAATDVTLEEAGNIGKELRKIMRETDGFSTGNTDYSGSSMVARAAKAQAQADRFQGDPALPPPHIAGAIPRKQVQHEPVRTTHTHLHPSFGTVDGEDGLHLHEHDHSGDSLHAHDHEYGGDELRPGKESGPGMAGG